MRRKKRLRLYKKALKDWERPYEDSNYTDTGFCHYFDKKHNVLYFELSELIKCAKYPDKTYHYDGLGVKEKGREQRVNALKEAIKIASKKTWLEKFLQKIKND